MSELVLCTVVVESRAKQMKRKASNFNPNSSNIVKIPPPPSSKHMTHNTSSCVEQVWVIAIED